MFERLREEWGVPLEVVNDGDVTALAGALSLEENAVLGVAMLSFRFFGLGSVNSNMKAPRMIFLLAGSLREIAVSSQA